MSGNDKTTTATIIKLRGFTPYAYRDRSRDRFTAVDIWDLELRLVQKDVKLRNFLMYDYKDARKSKEESLIPAIGSRGQVIGLRKDQHFLDTELLYVPIRLVGKRWHNVPESEIDMYRDETRETENIYWQDQIEGNSPFTELLRKANVRMEEATHPVIIDEALTAASEINTNPRSEDIELFFKPISQCNRYDCALEHNQVKAFVREHNKANKRAVGFALLGARFDSEDAIKFDNLKSLEHLVKLASLTFNVTNLNNSIWDSWDKLDELDN